MTAQLSHFSTASVQCQLAACVKAAHDIASHMRVAHADLPQIDAAMAGLKQFEAIMQAQLTGKVDFPPALKPLQRAMDDVLEQAGHLLAQDIPESDDVEQALVRMENGQAAITQASIAGFMMLTHLARALQSSGGVR